MYLYARQERISSLHSLHGLDRRTMDKVAYFFSPLPHRVKIHYFFATYLDSKMIVFRPHGLLGRVDN